MLFHEQNERTWPALTLHLDNCSNATLELGSKDNCDLERESKGYTMIQFLVKRLIGLVFVVLGVTFITFIMGYFAPDDPVTQLLGQHYTQQAYLEIRHAYGLDLPWYQQYYNFLIGLFHFNFGFSYQYKSRLVW